MDLASDHAHVRRSPLAPIAIALAVIGVSAFGGLFTDTTSTWYENLDLPAFQPPGAAFGAVWTVLYIALGVSAWRAWRTVTGPERRTVMALYGANFVLNAAWTLIFFTAQAPVVAGLEIILLLATIVALIRLMQPWDRLSAWLLIPYGLWVAFATVLTWTIALTN